eukprot:CAMPEP_0198567590 /NCGR_PEP_ID=MMETSP1462-20131121/105023_1 /TAXON_ID=1333877 /ORGANISM="Brandtodinium nutriculum, Strain RCC3387" /LENGTH=224 /DNA_ID=CAMNT_0044298635 /DNA_START=70 /DNA_END=741 /DNA_ORIENTATION=+
MCRPWRRSSPDSSSPTNDANANYARERQARQAHRGGPRRVDPPHLARGRGHAEHRDQRQRVGVQHRAPHGRVEAHAGDQAFAVRHLEDDPREVQGHPEVRAHAPDGELAIHQHVADRPRGDAGQGQPGSRRRELPPQTEPVQDAHQQRGARPKHDDCLDVGVGEGPPIGIQRQHEGTNVWDEHLDVAACQPVGAEEPDAPRRHDEGDRRKNLQTKDDSWHREVA